MSTIADPRMIPTHGKECYLFLGHLRFGFNRVALSKGDQVAQVLDFGQES